MSSPSPLLDYRVVNVGIMMGLFQLAKCEDSILITFASKHVHLYELLMDGTSCMYLSINTSEGACVMENIVPRTTVEDVVHSLLLPTVALFKILSTISKYGKNTKITMHIHEVSLVFKVRVRREDRWMEATEWTMDTLDVQDTKAVPERPDLSYSVRVRVEARELLNVLPNEKKGDTRLVVEVAIPSDSGGRLRSEWSENGLKTKSFYCMDKKNILGTLGSFDQVFGPIMMVQVRKFLMCVDACIPPSCDQQTVLSMDNELPLCLETKTDAVELMMFFSSKYSE